MGLSYDQKVQERIMKALEGIHSILSEAADLRAIETHQKEVEFANYCGHPAPELPVKRKRGRPPKVTNG